MAKRIKRLEKVRHLGGKKPELLSFFADASAGHSLPFERGGTLLAERTASRPGDNMEPALSQSMRERNLLRHG
ncbi:unnamed protein product, partial [Clonostachys chloroleuca]